MTSSGFWMQWYRSAVHTSPVMVQQICASDAGAAEAPVWKMLACVAAADAGTTPFAAEDEEFPSIAPPADKTSLGTSVPLGMAMRTGSPVESMGPLATGR